ncbi:MAG: Sec-independent protein translocase protein TatB [Terricaulis sp.]
MLPSLGFQEILLLGVLALVVIGPKDLPLMLRKLGRWTAKLRGMAQEFRSGFDELARQAELDELKKEVEALRRTTNLNSLANEITKPITSALPTLEDYAGISKQPPAAPEISARLPLDGGGVAEGDGEGVCAVVENDAAGGSPETVGAPHPLSHAARDSSPIEGEREDAPIARSAP